MIRVNIIPWQSRIGHGFAAHVTILIGSERVPISWLYTSTEGSAKLKAIALLENIKSSIDSELEILRK